MALDFIAGAGAGAQDALAALLERQLREQLTRQQMAEAQQRLELDRKRLDMQGRQHQDMLDLNERERRDRNNRAGVDEQVQQRQLMDQQEDRAAAAEQAGTQRRVIGNLTALTSMGAPKREIIGELMRINPAAAASKAIEPSEEEELARLRKEREIIGQADAKYRRDPAPVREPKQWILRDGQELYVGESEIQPGDRRAPSPSSTSFPTALKRQLDEVTLLEQQIKEIEDFGNKIEWRGVGGLMQGRAKQFMKQQLGEGPNDEETLRNMIGNLRTDISHEKFGSAFTKTERDQLNSFAPDISRHPSAIQTSLKTLRERAAAKRAQLQSSAVSPNRTGAPAMGATTADPVLDELERRRKQRGGG